MPDKYVHEPWKMSDAMMEACGVKIGPGRDYPAPIVDPTVQPSIMSRGANGGRGRGRGKQGGRGRGNGQRRENNNSNRSKSQRKDMKSLKEGSYSFGSY